MSSFTLRIPHEVERQLQRCRKSIRELIQKRLADLAQRAATGPVTRKKAVVVTKGPPLRFYALEGYRVSYQVNPKTRQIVVLDLRPASS